MLEQDQQRGELSVGDISRLILDNLWLILAITAAAIAVAYYVIKTTPVSYKSKVVLRAEFKQDRVLEFTPLEGPETARSFEFLNTIASGISRRQVLGRVAARILNDTEIHNWTTNEPTVEQITGILVKRVQSRPRRQTQFIDVEVIDQSPAYAQKVAQLVAEEYLADEMERRLGSGSGATNFLSDESVRLRQQFGQSEGRLEAFLRTNVVSVGKESDELASSDLIGLNNHLLEAKSDRLRLETDLGAITEAGRDVERLLSIQSVLESERVAEVRKTLSEKKQEMVNLEQRYKAKHPKMIEGRKLLENLQANLDREVRRAPDAINVEFKKAKLKELQLELVVKEAEKKMTDRNVATMEYQKLVRSRDNDYEQFQRIEKRIQEAIISSRNLERKDANHDVSVFEPAELPEFPFAPDKKMIVAVALVLGMGLSFGVVYLLHLLDMSVKSVDQAERMFGVPVLGAVPKSSEIRGDDQRLILAADPNSLCSEAFRTLRAAISLLGREDERKVTLFTSAVPSEGKTFCSSNFALASANQGRRTLIVDFDLRRPSVGNTFRIDQEQVGVSDCLLGKVSIEDAAVRTEYENLDVMTAGTIVPNPSELISSKHTPEFIDAVKEKYDQVIIDNAPVTAVSDTLLILKYVDTVCLVSRAAKTSYRLIGRAMELIRRGGVNPAGLVLNFVPQKGRSGYYYYYHSDKSYYGGYGQSKKKSKRSDY